MSEFLDLPALRAGAGGGVWSRIDLVPATGSTNADLAAAARAGSPAGRVLVTGDQRSGRGRFRRPWVAPPGTSVACSVLVAPTRPVADWGWLPLVVGMAVADGVREACGLDTGLKWPNDVLVAERKLCGILCESVITDDGPRAVLGLGLNVGLREADLPVPTATSTYLEGSTASATWITAAVLRRLEHWLAAWESGAPLVEAYRDRCLTLGRAVSVQLAPEGAVTGRAVSVDESGALVLRTADGLRTLVAGDVVHLRPDQAGAARKS